ncbi:retrovirus-related Pol polyprotein from transposon 17.6 [Trichonephila clavipes]|nr:retrovirus-related Pol polyprotein from transposon 17.6 [Trichonephila clavipes]
MLVQSLIVTLSVIFMTTRIVYRAATSLSSTWSRRTFKFLLTKKTYPSTGFSSFGLRNSGQTFQRFIDGVLHGLDFCFAYIDDILVFSANNDEHHLRIPFQRLSDHGLLVNVFKSCLGKTSVTFLGYQVSSEGTRPLPDRIADLQNFPVPKTARDLRRFLGMINFYRRFLPSAANYQSSLNDVLSGLRGAQPVTWTSELHTAFSKCKEALSEVTLLTHPAPDVPLGLFMDASAHHVGAALMQRVNDHKSITYAFLQRREKLPPVQLRELSFIGQFTTDIQHISGAEDVVADAFSRISYIVPPPVDLKAIAEAQKGDT